MKTSSASRDIVTTPVAIIGMGCFFSKSNDLKSYWRLLSGGMDGVTEPPDMRRNLNDYFDGDPKRPDHIYCNRGGYISPITFDPTEFGIPPNILEATDTSQLLGLLAAKRALVDAGYGNGKPFDRDRTSVIIGVTGTQELVIPLSSRLGHPKWREALNASGVPPEKTEEVIQRIADGYVPWQENSFPGLLGNVVAGRICNRLDFGGTNCVVDAACASSLSAVHLALLELVSGRSQMVVTGGVDTLNDIFMHMCFSKTAILSPTGDVRPFSKNADGTVLGEGVGLMVLKRLSDAERDGDRIYAVIKGIGSSSDGKSQSIYAPRAEGQARALETAYATAGVDPETVELVEAHGTGTRVGDQVEVSALKSVFGKVNPNGNRCALGSVKSMVGHTKAAAGSAGLIKAALSIYHKVLPPTLKVDPPDPKLEIEKSPFYLSTEKRPWLSRKSHPRRAGISSFGFGGSNFHMVIEEYSPRKSEVAWDGVVEIIALSGDTDTQLISTLAEMKTALEEGTGDALPTVAAQSRKEFDRKHNCRLLMVVDTISGPSAVELCHKAIDQLKARSHEEQWQQNNLFYGRQPTTEPIAFMFPGQGSQYRHMGRDLICAFPEAMAALDEANAIYEGAQRLSDHIFPKPPFSPEEKQEQDTELRQTDVAQPAIGAVSRAMFRVLDRFGIQPAATFGHSYGELTALHAAGRLDPESFMKLSVARGRLMAEAGRNADGDPGTMLAVKAPMDELAALVDTLDHEVILANRNSPDQGVLSGATEHVRSAEKRCKEKGFRCMPLPVAAAFHSPLVESAHGPFAAEVAGLHLAPSYIPVYSNLKADRYPDEAETAGSWLSDQLINAVQFVGEVEKLYEDGYRTFVEVGPKSVLSGLVSAILKEKTHSVIALDESNGKRSGLLDLAKCLCRLSAMGYPVILEEWEYSRNEEASPKMRIPISGANYEDPKRKTSSPPPRPVASLSTMPQKQANIATNGSIEGKITPPGTPKAKTTAPVTQPIQPAAPVPGEGTTAPDSPNHEADNTHPASAAPRGKTMTSHGSKQIQETLRVVQQGLASMQSLQQQTAQAHQKFLETQAQAGRTLQEMMNSTQRLAEATMGIAPSVQLPAAAPPATRQPEPVLPPVVPSPRKQPEATAPSPIASTEKVHTETASMPAAASPTPPPKPDGLQTTLLEIVSELTGYPADMLDTGMDIEADLGIDSIKRVEILSTLEERKPGLPKVTPEMMGELKTLAQIIDFLGSSDTAPVQAIPVTPVSQPASPATPSSDREDIGNTLLEIVSELTGYPADMLDTGMDIEADLGIDSIKRVEILSTLEERKPGLPKVTPEMMGELKTLAQIIDFLGSSDTAPVQAIPVTPVSQPASPATPSSDREDIGNTLLEIVSELTGYPADMLDTGMDIEADLGIDSIKRVEILSTLEERKPGLPKVTPEMMGELKTLAQIIDFLGSSDTAPVQAIPVTPVSQPASPASPSPDREDIGNTLLEIVSELTGYPADMLDTGMDIEADLGIDSIKRVEILSTLEERKPGLPKVTPEMMGELKTLAQIIDFLSGISIAQDSVNTTVFEKSAPVETIVRSTIETQSAPIQKPVARYEIKPVSAELNREQLFTPPTGRKIYVTGDESAPFGEALKEKLTTAGYSVKFITGDAAQPSESIDDAAGLILLESTAPKSAFQTARRFAPVLMAAAKEGDALFATISRLDGAFGFFGKGVNDPVQGALAGLAKTAALEWDGVICRAIDVDPSWRDQETVCDRIGSEIRHAAQGGSIEVGLQQDRRIVLELDAVDSTEGQLDLSSDDVVVVSGGGRGVTAQTIIALARECKATFILLGRSPLPSPEPLWLHGIADPAGMKKAILRNQYPSEKVSPKELEQRYGSYMANRELTATLDAIRHAGARVGYMASDIRNQENINTIFNTIRTEYGAVTALIHGAGVLEDRRIVDKTDAQFDNVFSTKVAGLNTLLRAAEADDLKYLVLFSSVSARMGNNGQADYAMANEILNKTAWQQRQARPQCRVVSINWGPWDGGMVTPSLKREFEKQGVSLIPLAEGAACMIREMRGAAGDSPAEVVVGGPLPAHKAQGRQQGQPQPLADTVKTPVTLSLLQEQEIDLQRYPILEDHVIGGRPVIPFALITEWLGHSAMHGNPGLRFIGIDDIRLLNGIKMDQASKGIHLLSGNAVKRDQGYEVAVEIRNNKNSGKEIVHSRAKVMLAENMPEPPSFKGRISKNGRKYVQKIKEWYDKLLFHGDRLQGIKAIHSLTKKRIVASLEAAPQPEVWIASPLRSSWISDPLILDCAFQMAIIWCHDQKGVLSLPSYAASYRQFCEKFPSEGVTAVLDVKKATRHRFTGDFTFLDEKGTVVASLTGYEAVMDASLYDAFKSGPSKAA